MNRRIILIIAAMLSLASCSKFVEFKDFFIAFDVLASSTTTVNCEANMTGDYKLHMSATARKKPVLVKFSVIPGDGLQEGVDYTVLTKNGQLEFYPGTYDKPIQIRWISHDIDPSKDCSLTIRLDSVNDDLLLGYPGTDNLYRSITIRKIKTK